MMCVGNIGAILGNKYMTPKQHKKLMDDISVQVTKIIKETVNGKIDKLTDSFQTHLLSDENFQNSMKPMIEVFDTNNIYKMKLKTNTGTIVFYAKSALTIGSFLAGTWWVINKLTR